MCNRMNTTRTRNDSAPPRFFFHVIICLSIYVPIASGFCSFLLVAKQHHCHSPDLPARNQRFTTLSSLFSSTTEQTPISDYASSSSTAGDEDLLLLPTQQFNRQRLESKFQKDGTLSRRWGEFLRETAPLVQQSAQLWAAGRLSRNDPSLAAACRQTLTRLGPAFVKLGQILSVREDILGPVWSEELSKLQNSVEAFGGRNAVEEAIMDDSSIQEGLEWFDPTPIAVASIAQVHKGQWRLTTTTKNGTTTTNRRIEVAIKVLRPQVIDQVGVDLCVLLRAGDVLSEWVPRILPVSRVDWQALLEGLAKGLWQEVDLAGEAQRQERFRHNMESVPRVLVPRVIAYNRHVMISEWVDGTPLRAIPSMDYRLKNAQALMRDAYCQSMYVDAFFHADGHGGNLLWVENNDNNREIDEAGELCILDCGLMVDIEPSAAEGLLRLSLHLAARDWTQVVQDVMDLGFLPHDLSPSLQAEARGIARRIIGPYLDVGGGANGAASAYSISTLLDDISLATRKLPTSLPPDMILLARAVIQLEGLALRAYPDYRLVDDILPVAAKLALRSTSSSSKYQSDDRRSSLLFDLLYESSDSGEIYRGTKETMSFSPERLLQLLGTARSGSQQEAATNSSQMTMEAFLQELIQADAARELIAEETTNVLDALVRDAVWRGVDSLAEQGLVPTPPSFLFNFWKLPSPTKTLETLAPRVSEKEQLILIRVKRMLEELETNEVPNNDNNSVRLSNRLLNNIPLVQFATIPGMDQALQRVVVAALWQQDSNTQAALDTVSEKLRDRMRTRLVNTDMISSPLASELAAILFPTPWAQKKVSKE